MEHARRNWSGMLVLALAFLCATAAGAAGLTFRFKTYDVANATQTWLTGVNDKGMIVGWFVDQQGNAHGFTLTNGNFQQVDNGPQTEIWGVNSEGNFVGTYYDSCVEEICNEGFRFHSGVFSDIGPKWFSTPPEDDAPDSEAFGINDGGNIVGMAGDGFGSEVGFLRAQGRYAKLEVPGVNGEQAIGINKAGLVTLAWASNDYFGVSLYDGTTYQDISVPNGTNSYHGGINNNGDVVLGFDAGFGQPIHGALLHAGKYYQFDDPDSKYLTLPLGLNDKHKIVGVWNDGQQEITVHGFIATY